MYLKGHVGPNGLSTNKCIVGESEVIAYILDCIVKIVQLYLTPLLQGAGAGAV